MTENMRNAQAALNKAYEETDSEKIIENLKKAKNFIQFAIDQETIRDKEQKLKIRSGTERG